ncbi:MAG: phosphonate ABC transporter ATP-binding protein [Chloroflexota bacterium]
MRGAVRDGVVAGAAVTCEAVDKTYRRGHVAALRGLSFAVTGGEAVAFIGPSGAGKTTLLRLLSRFLRADAGQVAIDGRDLATLSPREVRAIRRQTGVVYQQHNLVQQLRVVHNVLAGCLGTWSVGASVASLVAPSGTRREIARQALAAVGVQEQIDAVTADLSGGQRQRVAIARVLVQNPRLILADEPVASLDPRAASGVLELLLRLQQREGKTLLVSLHDLGLARRYFSRVIALAEGRLVFDGHPSGLTDTMLDTIYGSRSVVAADG